MFLNGRVSFFHPRMRVWVLLYCRFKGTLILTGCSAVGMSWVPPEQRLNGRPSSIRSLFLSVIRFLGAYEIMYATHEYTSTINWMSTFACQHGRRWGSYWSIQRSCGFRCNRTLVLTKLQFAFPTCQFSYHLCLCLAVFQKVPCQFFQSQYLVFPSILQRPPVWWQMCVLRLDGKSWICSVLLLSLCALHFS